MPTFTTVDAAWTPGPTTTFSDEEARRFDTAMFLGDGSANGVRGGIVRHGDNSLAVTVNGSDQVTVQPGAFVIPAPTGLGVYRGALAAAVGPTAATAITARNATNPRIDLVTIHATGTAAEVKTVDGTPGASPSAPALPAQHIELARITVPAVGGGAVTVDSSWRAYATGLGGTLYVETSARLPGSGNQKGQKATALDTGLEHVWNGAAWVAGVPLGAWTGWTPTLSGFTAQAGLQAFSTRIGKTVHASFACTLATATAPFTLTLPAAVARTPVASLAIGTAWSQTAGVWYTAAVVVQSATPTLIAFHPHIEGDVWGSASSTPASFAVGTPLSFTITYESA